MGTGQGVIAFDFDDDGHSMRWAKVGAGGFTAPNPTYTFARGQARTYSYQIQLEVQTAELVASKKMREHHKAFGPLNSYCYYFMADDPYFGPWLERFRLYEGYGQDLLDYILALPIGHKIAQ